MTPSTPSLADIVTHTPVWVWPLLALLVWRGLRNTQPREADIGGLVLLPLVLSALSAYGILTSPFSTMVGLGLLVGIGSGIATARVLESRHPAQAIATGRLLLPGDWTGLAAILIMFSLRYGSAVLGAVQPAMLANPAVQLVSTTMAAFVVAMLVSRMVLRLNQLRHAALAA